MHFDLFALYAGPDQVMTVTSGLASLVGLLLIFWNKVVAVCSRMVRFFYRTGADSSAPSAQEQPSKNAPPKTS